MRILWFSVTPSLYNPHSNSHNGGGWIASLEQIIRKETSIQLGVAFEFPDGQFKYEKDGVCYYPIASNKLSLTKRLLKRENSHQRIVYYLKIIDDFKPDLIQIFGSENDFGLVCNHTDIPVVIHIQGSLPPCHNALFPIGMNKYDFLVQKGLGLRRRFAGLRSESVFRRDAEREIQIIKSCQYFMGRTDWDRNLVSLFHPEATYFHCEEALRDSFIQGNNHWSLPTVKRVKIISVISSPWYKGVDLILKTAKLLKEFTSLDFEWNVYGVKHIHFYECKYKIYAADVNINIKGIASKEMLVSELCNSSCYVHPSYIENSPNSLCEAQYLGVPVIATHVGGIPSLIEDGKTGILFPANDPYTLSGLIRRIAANSELAIALSKREIEAATRRHNPDSILQSLISIYKNILSK